MVQWISLSRNNRPVLVHRYSVLEEKTVPILLPLVGLMAGRQVGEWGVSRWVGRQVGGWVEASRWVGRQADEILAEFEILKILYRLNYLGIPFVYYHCKVTTVSVLELHFCKLLSSKAYFKVCFELQKFGCHFFMLIPIIRY